MCRPLNPLLLLLFLSQCAGLPDFQFPNSGAAAHNKKSCDPKANQCEQGCVSDGDGTRCFCANGYHNVSGKSDAACELNEPNMGHIYYASGAQIVRFPVEEESESDFLELEDNFKHYDDRHGKTEVVVTLSEYGASVVSIDCQPGRNSLLFSVENSLGNKGYLQQYDAESGQQSCFVASLPGVKAVAVDFVTDNFYFVIDGAVGRQGVGVCELEGRFCQMVIEDPELKRLRGLAVHPRRGLMFLSDVSESGARIEAASMDGSQRRLLVSENVQWPQGLTIDYASERLYWVDGGYGTIERIDLFTGHRETVIDEGPQHPMDMLVFNHHIYWTDWFIEALVSADLRNTSDRPAMHHQSHPDIYGLAISHPAYHLGLDTPANPCRSKPCSHICLLNGLNESVSFTCRCPFGYEPLDGGDACKPIADYVPYSFVNDDDEVKVRDPHLCDAEMLRRHKESLACGSGGMLVKRIDDDGYYCRCPTGYIGTFCEVSATSVTLRSASQSSAVWILLFVAVLLVIVGIVIYCWRRRGAVRDSSAKGRRVHAILPESVLTAADGFVRRVSSVARQVPSRTASRPSAPEKQGILEQEQLHQHDPVRQVSSFHNPMYDEAPQEGKVSYYRRSLNDLQNANEYASLDDNIAGKVYQPCSDNDSGLGGASL